MITKFVFWTGIAINIGVAILNVVEGNPFSWINGVLLFNIVILTYTSIHSRTSLKNLTGLITTHPQTKDHESVLRGYLSETRSFVTQAEFVFSNITYIGQDQFTKTISSVNNDGIKTSLLSAHNKIIELRKNESEHNWITEQVAAISELKHKGNDISEYSFQVISTIIKSLNANQGDFYLLKKEHDECFFELQASYAYNKKKHLTKRIQLGDGLIGQVYYEKSLQYITDLPPDYIKITSGLGEALPRCLCIIPLISEGNIYGAIEIASFSKLEGYQMDYLRNISESIGYNLGTIEANSRTEILLAESQKMSQEVKSQEEELRQNMEELTATQEEMRRKQTETHAVMSSLSTVELDIDGNVIDANAVFLSITGFSLEDIHGKPYKKLTGQVEAELAQYDMMWNSIISGQSFSGEFRIINKRQKEIWMAGNFTPLLNEHGKTYKVMLVSLFTTQDKEKLQELQDLMVAIKSCMPVVEINQTLDFKSANDLFLSELGIRRIELRKTSLIQAFGVATFNEIETFLKEYKEGSKDLFIEINEKGGRTKRFSSTLTNVGAGQQKRGLLILRNPAN